MSRLLFLIKFNVNVGHVINVGARPPDWIMESNLCDGQSNETNQSVAHSTDSTWSSCNVDDNNCTFHNWSIMNRFNSFGICLWNTKFNFYLSPLHYRLFIQQATMFRPAQIVPSRPHTDNQFVEINWYFFTSLFDAARRGKGEVSSFLSFISLKLNKKLFYAKSKTLLRSGMFPCDAAFAVVCNISSDGRFKSNLTRIFWSL